MYTNFCNDIKMIVWWNVNPLPTVHASPTLYLSPYSKWQVTDFHASAWFVHYLCRSAHFSLPTRRATVCWMLHWCLCQENGSPRHLCCIRCSHLAGETSSWFWGVPWFGSLFGEIWMTSCHSKACSLAQMSSPVCWITCPHCSCFCKKNSEFPCSPLFLQVARMALGVYTPLCDQILAVGLPVQSYCWVSRA